MKCGAYMVLRDLTGMTFGRLLVTGQDGAYTDLPTGRRNGLKWACKCTCGGTTSVAGNHLKAGKVQSCGCLQKELARERRLLSEGEASFNAIFRSYKYGAEKRGLSFNLDKATFKALTKGDCAYCGAPPEKTRINNRQSTPYIYNGVDRVDNTKGYEEGNVVSCCYFCNTAKSTCSQEGFFAKVRAIYEYLSLRDE